MSLSPVRSDLGPAPLSRVITNVTAQVVLCDATNTPIAANPQSVNHPPSKILVVPPAAGGDIVWLDLNGTSNTLTLPASTQPFELPCTAKSIEAATDDTAFFVVAWHPEP